MRDTVFLGATANEILCLHPRIAAVIRPLFRRIAGRILRRLRRGPRAFREWPLSVSLVSVVLQVTTASRVTPGARVRPELPGQLVRQARQHVPSGTP